MVSALRLVILSPGEEQRLMRQWLEGGDRKARARLLESGIGWTWKIAMGYRSYGIAIDDLVQEGQIGVAEAIKRYDRNKGTRFLSYATFWIRARILSYIFKNLKIIGIGTGPNQSRVFFSLKRTMRQLQNKGKPIDTETLAAAMGVPVSVVESVAPRLLSQDCSLDAPRRKGGEEAYTLKSTLAADEPGPESLVVEARTRAAIQRLVIDGLKILDPRERLIIKGRMLADPQLTLQELGRQLNLSRERMRQLELRAKTKFRAHIAARHGKAAIAILLG